MCEIMIRSDDKTKLIHKKMIHKNFHNTTITSSWTLRKTKIPITIVKAQMPSNLNQKSHTRDNNGCNYLFSLRFDLIHVSREAAGISFAQQVISGWITLQWRHNERGGVSDHQPYDCLLGGFRAQRATNAKMFPFDDVIIIQERES